MAVSRLHWQSIKQISQLELPPDLRSWVLEQNSLTRRLKRSCKGQFEVRLERQCWRRPSLDEAMALKMRPDSLTLIREVNLLCDGEPRVYARTVVPLPTLRGTRRRLVRLGSRPLGDILFANARTPRRSIQVALIPVSDNLYNLATRKAALDGGAVWGRRSIFCLQGKPLLVVEIFLPALCR